MRSQAIALILTCLLIGISHLQARRNSKAKLYKRTHKKRQSAAEVYRRTKIFNAKFNPPLPPVSLLTQRPTNTIHCKIFARSGYHLQILPSGLVRGTVNQASKYVSFEMQSFGPSVVKLKNNATGRYLTMRRDGSLRGVRQSHGKETLFKETHEQNAFHSYASNRYFQQQPYDMLIGIKRNGQVKKATKTGPGQTSTQFLVIKLGPK